MRHSRWVVIIIFLASLWPMTASADTSTDHIVISELQTGSAASASQEFVELYNPTDQPTILDGWQIQYRPASSTSSWTSRTGSGLVGSIPAHGFFLIAPTSYLPNADAAFASGMAQTGGSVRLIDGSGQVIDLLGWGTAVEFETSPAPAATAGQSLERLPGSTDDTGGNWVDTNNNSDDFQVRTVAQPQSTANAIETPGEVGSAPTAANPVVAGSTAAADTTAVSQMVQINELFVDPAAPLSDSKDEFIELYNSGLAPANLTGYVLKTGSNFHDSYTLPAMTLAPGGYQALYSKQTKLSLTNSGGAAELLSPSGNVIDETAEYDGSLVGMSFSRFGSDWQWTTALTPGAANVFVAPPTANSVKAATAKTATKKATTKSKAKTAKAAKVKAPKAAKTAGGTNLTAAAQTSGLAAKWLIIGLASLTMGYAIYEFRYDLQNYYHSTQRKYRAWREARTTTDGR